MGMSYRRAWELVDAMNNCFSKPLVSTRQSGGTQNGAQVTELGLQILKSYRSLLNKTQSACQQELEEITRHLSPTD
jgi:molybdate transport system regulatory protein